jgi:hypothetical protein
MKAITTRNNTGPKPFAWSFSKLKNFEVCPKRHYHIDIQKDIKEDESDQLEWGNFVHKHMAERIKKSTALPEAMKHFEKWIDKVIAPIGDDEKTVILVEQKYAINKDFGATTFFDKSAWFRSIADVLKINGPVALLIDWKTGKIVEDSQQLALSAACVFAHYPRLQAIRSEFIWLKEDATTRVDIRRKDIVQVWRDLWPRITALEEAYNTNNYPPKRNRYCKRWCPVTTCPYHGE